VGKVELAILEHLLVALAAGGLIGFERSFHGRPAGFRTHTLVCIASSSLMLITLYGAQWFPAEFSGRVALDPTRMAQGIMTGIGFLGAGVIFKEGLTVRGLTTAASIWITAAIGILAGIGFYFPVIVTTALTLGTLSIFRWIESAVPSEFYAQLSIKFGHDAPMPQEDLLRFVSGHAFSVANLSYHYDADARFFEYRAVIRTRDAGNVKDLSEALSHNPAVREFSIRPTGD
jgi:putative Mg2+ transporter-C (MgtC) family protein